MSYSSKHLFPLDDMDLFYYLLSEQIPKPPRTASAQYRVYRGLVETPVKVFPVHQSFKELDAGEWREPERKFYFFHTWKRFPFEREIRDKYFLLSQARQAPKGLQTG